MGGEQGQRDSAARAKSQAAGRAAGDRQHFGIAAKPAGADIRRLDHGFPAANKCAVILEPRRAILQQRDIGGCAADIRHHGCLRAGEKSRPGEAGGRARQDRFNRPRARIMRANQRAVAFDHHQRAVKAEFGHDAFRCGNQLVEKIDQPGIQHGRQRAARPAKRG